MEQKYKRISKKIPLYALALGGFIGLAYNTYNGVQQSFLDKQRIERETLEKAPENLKRLAPYVNPDIDRLRNYLDTGLRQYEIDVDEDGFTDLIFRDVKTGRITYFKNINDVDVKEQKLSSNLRKRLEMLIESQDRYRKQNTQEYQEKIKDMA